MNKGFLVGLCLFVAGCSAPTSGPAPKPPVDNTDTAEITSSFEDARGRNYYRAEDINNNKQYGIFPTGPTNFKEGDTVIFEFNPESVYSKGPTFQSGTVERDNMNLYSQ